MQLGEALASGGLIMLVVMPIVYRVRAASMHVRERHALLWPTMWMLVPLVVLVIGVAVIALASRSSRPSQTSGAKSTGAFLDLTAEEAREAARADDARTASRSPT